MKMKTLAPKRITQGMIAKVARVAPPVVSVILSGQPTSIGVSDATRQRVLETARRLGYKSRFAAPAKTKTVVWIGETYTSSNAVGNWLDSTSGLYFQRMFHAVVNTLEQHEYVLTIKPWRDPDAMLDWLARS